MKRMIVVSLVFVVLSIIGQNGGFLHIESETYVPYYLSERPLLNILYDSKTLDGDMYQARELSYFFDYLDCKFIQLSTDLGFPHLLSITNYIFSFLIVLMLYRFFTGDLGIHPHWALGLGTLFWTTPYIFMGGLLFRSAKIGVALTLVYAIILLYRLLRGFEAPGWFTCAKLFFALFAMMLFDRQGFFLTGYGLIFTALWAIFIDRNKITLVIPFLAGILVDLLYNYGLAPWLTFQLNGYYPNFSYQQLPWVMVLLDPSFYVASGFSLFMSTFQFTLGNLPYVFNCLVLVAILLYFLIRKEFVTVILLGTSFILIVVMMVLMVLRHPALIGVRTTYYWIPSGILILCFLAIGIRRLQRTPSIPPLIVSMVLMVCIVGNMIALPGHYRSFHVNNGISFLIGKNVIETLRSNQYIDEVVSNPVYQALRR